MTCLRYLGDALFTRTVGFAAALRHPLTPLHVSPTRKRGFGCPSLARRANGVGEGVGG